MSTNLFGRFKKLLEGPPLMVGQVTGSSGGFSTVTLPGGGVLNVRGAAAIGSRVFVRGDLIEGVAPSLTATVIEV